MSRNIVRALRREAPGEVFDYSVLMGRLTSYANPRNQITRLLQSGDIVRIKKGLYVFGEEYRRGPISREGLANLIYGPSYVSLQSALSFYGLIPERVEAVTSMTMKRSKEFTTPVGRFSYRYINQERYAVGVDRVEIAEGQFCLMATPEKAIVDLLIMEGIDDLESYLEKDLRLSGVETLNIARLQRIAQSFRKPIVDRFLEVTCG